MNDGGEALRGAERAKSERTATSAFYSPPPSLCAPHCPVSSCSYSRLRYWTVKLVPFITMASRKTKQGSSRATKHQHLDSSSKSTSLSATTIRTRKMKEVSVRNSQYTGNNLFLNILLNLTLFYSHVIGATPNDNGSQRSSNPWR
jgi:hypothetical protein